MVLSTVNSIEKKENVLNNAFQIANYYAKLVYTDNPKSFDMYYIRLQLEEELYKIIDKKDSQENMYNLISLFNENISRISDNDYTKNPSVFYNELIKKLQEDRED